jgi:hypothetical protein
LREFAPERVNCLRIKWLSLVVGLVMVGCSDPSSGAIEQVNDPGAICGSVAADGSATVGILSLVNTAQDSVVVDSVELIESNDLSIIESRISAYPDGANIDVTPAFGLLDGYPPPETDLWRASVPAASAEIAPADASNDAFVLVLGLQMGPGVNKATASSVEIEYTADGGQFAYRFDNSIELHRDSQEPPGSCG